MEAFIATPANPTARDGFAKTILVTSSGTASFTAIPSPDVMISVRSNPVYFQWGKANNAAITTATAATQGNWLPQNVLTRIGKPQDSDGIWILQDTGAAQVFLTPGRGI